MTMVKPPALKQGDRVAVLAPASPFSREEFEAGLAELTTIGFEAVYDDRVFERDGYVAGSAETRARAFIDAWTDPSVRAVLTARGGYGSAQILPFLSRNTLQATPKLLVGYSDITALLSFVTTRCGIVTVHGPTLTGRFARGGEGYDRSSFLRAVCEAEPLGELRSPALETMRTGEAEGMLVGGNLTQLAATLGTPFAFDPPDGCVLFLEDVNERPYRVDRLLTQLRQAGVLSRATALVFGEMPGCDEPDGSLSANDAIARCVRDFPGPVVVGLASGHTPHPAITLPLGVRARVLGGARPALVITEAAVSPRSAS
ncbi:MAG: LD-carboxypeptidase [Acidobacteria bacterium]|jgi:muramoyltetrapeptide carboxypeptidase|nr:LD-carboxypeptidase [Acidobacteriota bacterium]